MAAKASPRPWRRTRDNEIIDAEGNTVAWGYHEDFGMLCQKIKRVDADLIIAAVNTYKQKHG